MRWFISDPHLDHDKVLMGLRKEHFPTIEEWQEGFIDGCRKSCKKGDQLFILGDFALKNPQRWRSKLALRGVDTWLIYGNHDASKGECMRAFGESRVRDVYMTKCADVKTWLSHYATAYWDQSHHNCYHLYGHTHGQREESLDLMLRTDAFANKNAFEAITRAKTLAEARALAIAALNDLDTPQRRSMEVCPETIYRAIGEWRPINENEVHDILGSREGHDQVRFYKELRGECAIGDYSP